MALKITLKPLEKIVINGCVVENGPKKTSISIENYADVIRETDIMQPEEAAESPLKKLYFKMQTSLLDRSPREDAAKEIQHDLADLVHIVSGSSTGKVFEAANEISVGNFYKAMKMVKFIINNEKE